jgi:hypothetical protein
MDRSEDKNIEKGNSKTIRLAKQIDAISWGLFFIMIGGIGLIPAEKVPQGIWLIGVGLIMVGNNIVRYFYRIKMIGFTVVLGIIALLAGIGDYLGIDVPVFPLLLVLVGISIIIGFLKDKK